jgi:hypothetical protein
MIKKDSDIVNLNKSSFNNFIEGFLGDMGAPSPSDIDGVHITAWNYLASLFTWMCSVYHDKEYIITSEQIKTAIQRSPGRPYKVHQRTLKDIFGGMDLGDWTIPLALKNKESSSSKEDTPITKKVYKLKKENIPRQWRELHGLSASEAVMSLMFEGESLKKTRGRKIRVLDDEDD